MRKMQIEKITEVDEEDLEDESIINSHRSNINNPKISFRNNLIFQMCINEIIDDEIWKPVIGGWVSCFGNAMNIDKKKLILCSEKSTNPVINAGTLNH